MDSVDGKISNYRRFMSYETIYGYNTQLSISVYIFKEKSNSYKIIISGQIANENPVEGFLEIQSDGSAKAKN